MKISELRPGMRRVDVNGTITRIDSPREVNTRYGPGKVADAMLKDESGEVKVPLWNESIDQVQVNDNVMIQNGYVESFRGEMQLNVGRYGKITKQ